MRHILIHRCTYTHTYLYILVHTYDAALIRLDALKLCYTRQRPIAVKTSGIGVWEDVLQIMSGT